MACRHLPKEWSQLFNKGRRKLIGDVKLSNHRQKWLRRKKHTSRDARTQAERKKNHGVKLKIQICTPLGP